MSAAVAEGVRASLGLERFRDWFDRLVKPGMASIAAVGSPTVGGQASGTLALNRTGVTAGNTLILTVNYFHGGTSSHTASAPTYTGAASGTASTALNAASLGSATQQQWGQACVFYVYASASGTYNFSITAPNPSNNYIYGTVAEFSGVLSPYLESMTAVNSADSTTAQTNTSPSTGTLAHNNDLIIASVVVLSGAGQASIGITNPPTGYTSLSVNQNTSSQVGSQTSYKILSKTTASQSTSWSWTDSTTLHGISSISAWVGPVTTVTAWTTYFRRINALLRM